MDQHIYNKSSLIDSGCESCSTNLSDTLIVSDVKFNNGPLEVEEVRKTRIRKNSIDIELKRKQEEEYNTEVREQRYKRLMHLLHKSKFYSSYLKSKIKDDTNKKKKVIRKRKHSPVNDENIPPIKKKSRKVVEEYNIQEYISTEIKKQVTKDKNNLSMEEIEEQLSADSDIEVDSKAIANNTTVPKYFCGELRDYQQAGLEWLKLLYENALSGILADEMGLGKTIQSIALICHLIEKRQPGPYLIIAPLSTIPNWLVEFETFAPAIPVVLFYGTRDEREEIRINIKRTHHVADGYRTQPVVITTYEVPLLEIKFLQSQKWKYIIIDEGHRIKNHNCKLVKYVTVKN